MTGSSVVSIPDNLKGKTAKIRAVSDKPCTLPNYDQSHTTYFTVYTRKENVSGDGTQRIYLSVGALSNDYIDVSGNLDIALDDDVVYLNIRYVGAGASFDNLHLKVLMYDVDTTIVDTEETIENGENGTFNIPSGYSLIDSGIHKNKLIGVLDTKTYIDNHIPEDVVTLNALEEYNPTEENLKYITPEMFGAVGDGVTDDSVAFQSALDAVTRDTPLRAYKNYYIGTGLTITGSGLDIFINRIDYRGGNSGIPAITLHGEFNNIHINILYAYFATGCPGFRLEATETYHIRYNEIRIDTLYSGLNCIEFINEYGISHTRHAYYNRIYIHNARSGSGHIIYNNCDRHFGENSFWGKHIGNGHGYLLYNETNAYATKTNRLYEFCIESDSQYGVHGPCTLINCRTAESQDRMTADRTEGFTYVGAGIAQDFDAINTYLTFVSVDVSGCMAYTDLLQKAKTMYEGGSSTTNSFDAAFPNTLKKYVLGKSIRIGPYNTGPNAQGDNVEYTQPGYVFAYLNHKGYIPDNDWPKEITDTTYSTWLTDASFPTIFYIKANTTITLDDSYCAVGIKEFRIVQENGFVATVYDHNNIKIFDGSNLGDGTFVIRCDLQDPDAIVIETSRGTITRSSRVLRGHYFGDNEKWSVEKLNIV